MAPTTASIAGGDPPTLDGFAVSGLLGAGGFGRVWEAVRERDETVVALKVGHGPDASVTARFSREADALCRVGPPYVPVFHQAGRLDDGRPYLVMERLFGLTLAARLEALPSPPAVDFVRAAADAILASLAAVHERGLVHHDLKPENIFFVDGATAEAGHSEPDSARLMDFGLVRGSQDDPGVTTTGTVVGTLEYMAPEELEGARDPDPRSDVYSFGVILYELLTLRVPFAGDPATVERGHRALRPPPPREIAPIPAPLSELVLACLAKDRARRPPDVPSVRRALARACETHFARGGPDTLARPRRGRGPLASAGSHEPVVLLWVEVRGDAAALSVVVERRGGFVARQRGTAVVCTFPGRDGGDPGQAAIGAAHELARDHGRMALHLAAVTLRRKESGSWAVYGAAVERPETWLPGIAWHGTLVSESLSSILPAGATVPGSHGFHCLAQTRPAQALAAETTLVGRDTLLAEATASLRASLGEGRPGLFTVLGARGLGKSRLARELSSLVRRTFPEASLTCWRAGREWGGAACEADRILFDVGLAPGADHVTTVGGVRRLGDALRERSSGAAIAVILDDAHEADSTTLEALEYATLDGSGIRLWVVVLADPRLEVRRPRWGARTERHTRVVLEPLAQEAAMKLAAELLIPAEYPPAAALQQLAGWTGGVPLHLTEVARLIHREGVVRRRAGTDSSYLATLEIERLAASPLLRWLASRELDRLPAETTGLVRLCSALGPAFSPEEVEWIQDAAERDGAPLSSMDAGVGLRELVVRDIFSPLPDGRTSFRSALLQDAVYELLAPPDRERIHRQALTFWRGRVHSIAPGSEHLERLGRHAAAAGAHEEAAEAYLALAHDARTAHRHLDADRYYSSAVGCARRGAPRYLPGALAGRGTVRYRLNRFSEARDDLGAARELVAAEQNVLLEAEILLEDATALDFMEEHVLSAQRVEEARPLVELARDPRLALRLRVGLGRTHFRAGRPTETVEVLSETAADAEQRGDHEARIVSLLLLSCALVLVGRIDDAEARFEEVIGLCERVKDRLLLCGAYANRSFLWTSRRRPERAMDDLRRVIELAREIGSPIPERIATHNLAEMLHWSGETEGALSLARRAELLRQRFIERAVPDDVLLLARIHLARGEREQAETHLAWIVTAGSPEAAAPSVRLLFRTVRLALEDRTSGAQWVEDSAWDDLISEARDTLPVEELLEVLFFRALSALELGDPVAASRVCQEVGSRLVDAPIWRARFAALEPRLSRR